MLVLFVVAFHPQALQSVVAFLPAIHDASLHDFDHSSHSVDWYDRNIQATRILETGSIDSMRKTRHDLVLVEEQPILPY